MFILSWTTSEESNAGLSPVSRTEAGRARQSAGEHRGPMTPPPRTGSQHAACLPRCRPATRRQTAKPAAGSSYYLSVTLWWPRSTGFEVVTGEGVRRGVKAAVVQNQKEFCWSPLLAPHGLELLELLWDPYWLRASKQRQLIIVITHEQVVTETTAPESQLLSSRPCLAQERREARGGQVESSPSSRGRPRPHTWARPRPG